MISVAIVEDNADLREGFAFIIDSSDKCVCVGTYPDGESALEALVDEPPDVILMDIEMPGISGIECTEALKAKVPDVDILMITVHADDKYVFDLNLEKYKKHLILNLI